MTSRHTYNVQIAVVLNKDPGDEMECVEEHLLATLNERLGQMAGDDLDDGLEIVDANVDSLEGIE